MILLRTKRSKMLTTTVVLLNIDLVSENFTAMQNTEPLPTANGKPICTLRVAYSIRLIKVSLCRRHSPALTAWLTTPAKGSLYGVWRKHSRAHFSCGRHNLSSRQQLKDTNIGSIEQRAAE